MQIVLCIVESIRADFALNYAKKDYIAANRWRCSSYAYKQIWIPYICEKSQRGSLFKVKRSIIKHLYFARHLPKMFLFSSDRFLLVPTIPKLFSFLKSVHQNRFYKPFCVFGSWGQRSFWRKMSRFKVVRIWSCLVSNESSQKGKYHNRTYFFIWLSGSEISALKEKI